ncbi:MAG TPA: acyltransferase [Flavisolibacter sp.]|nr:acyltransferase [Flavisolibacter sp.]
MPSDLLKRFGRITSSTTYLPEVDGLRFLAIFSVVAIMHIPHYLDEKFFGNRLTEDSYWGSFFFGGGSGVPLFFMISGFILSLPFARWHMQAKERVSLKRYYLRRLARLEPPYLIVLLILFAAQVWLMDMYGFRELLPHLLASAVYLHTLVYHSFSLVLPVAWSLEVEVQFYLLAPLFFLLFRIRNVVLRRSILLVIILAGIVWWFDDWGLPHLFKFLHFFFMGMLLADLHSNGYALFRNRALGLTVGLVSLAVYFFLHRFHYFPTYFLHIASMFFLFHSVLANGTMKKLFSLKGFALIGGMCYSIYLLHFAVISAVGQLMSFKIEGPVEAIAAGLVLAVSVLLVSAVFFLLVEKPFMRTAISGRAKA